MKLLLESFPTFRLSYCCPWQAQALASDQPSMQPDLFGAGAKLLLAIPSEIENELELLNGLRVKTGPHADAARLLQHIRSSRGKLHWAGEVYAIDRGSHGYLHGYQYWGHICWVMDLHGLTCCCISLVFWYLETKIS